MFNLKLFLLIIKEFFKALGKAHTYNIKGNWYAIFGILWGIPVPIVTIGMGLYYRALVPSINNIINEVFAHGIQFFFLLHPAIFAIVFGAMGTVRDEKERQRLCYEKSLVEINKKLKSANEKLRELDELKDNFLSMVSHELWSPLTTVQGYVTFMRGGKAGPLTERQKEILEIAEEHTDHLNRLIGELVDISKIEAGKFEVELDSLDMASVAGKAIDSLRRTAEGKNVILKNELPSRLPCVLADKKRIIQVLANLLGNAVKFTPQRGAVSISAREKDKAVEFSVADTGIGIPQDDLDKIFEKFYQVDSRNKREYGGCGLGLAITKSIIELHHGRIWVESKVGAGSKFFFELEKCKEVGGKFRREDKETDSRGNVVESKRA